MKSSKLMGVVIAALVVLTIALNFFLVRIPPATIGVKQNLWFGSGVVDKDYPLGFRLGITGFHKWHFLDQRTHFLTFAEEGAGSGIAMMEPALVVRTKDNNTATFDLTFTYKIIPTQGYRLIKDGLKDVYRERISKTVQSVIREELAELSSEDIYSTEKRFLVAQEMLPLLEEELAAFYVQPEQILIRAVSFTPAYEVKLQEKQLTNQKRLLATAQEKVERQRAITETKEAEIEAAEKEARGDWDKRLETLRAENEIQIARVNAEAEVYDKRVRAEADADYETLIAEGRLAVAKSEALRDELRNKALDTVGGRIFLATQAAENLRIDHVTLNSNDPSVPTILDVDGLVRLLIGSED